MAQGSKPIIPARCRRVAAAGRAVTVWYLVGVERSSGRQEHQARGRRRFPLGLLLACAAVAVPAVAHALVRRRLRAPEAAGWGRTRRYAGHFGQLFFQELGAGPPIVLLHGFGPGFDSGQWRTVAEALAPHGRVLAADLPGWGRSTPVPPRPEMVLASLADFLTGVAWEPAVVVAAGHAAPYAVHLAAAHPGLVRALALVAPLGFPGMPESVPEAGDGAGSKASAATAGDGEAVPRAGNGSKGGERAAADDRRDGARPLVGRLLQVPLLRVSVLDALTSRAVLAHYLRHHAYAAPERVDAAVLERHYRVSHLPAHRQALAAYWRGELDLPAGAALAQLRLPVWVGLGGAGPEATVPERPRDLPPGAEVEVIPGSRALPHAEQPLAVGAALLRFLARLPSPRPA
jgi:pimeloyl-ACP methyl ester carboxylesterase